MKNRLIKRTVQESTGAHESTEGSQAQVTPKVEFLSVDEMLRYDAAGTLVPRTLDARLQESLAHEPAPESSPPSPLPWWKRWLHR